MDDSLHPVIMNCGDITNSSSSSYFSATCESPTYSEVDSTSLQMPSIVPSNGIHEIEASRELLNSDVMDTTTNESTLSTPSTLRCPSAIIVNGQHSVNNVELIDNLGRQITELHYVTRNELQAMRAQLDCLEERWTRTFESIYISLNQLLQQDYKEQAEGRWREAQMPRRQHPNATVSTVVKNEMPLGTSDVPLVPSFTHPIPAVRISKAFTCPTNGTYDLQLNLATTAATNATLKSGAPPPIVPADMNRNELQSNSICDALVKHKLFRLPAMVRGYLTRRLYKCHEVEELKKTLTDTVIELMSFDIDRIDDVSLTSKDIELHLMIAQQMDRTLDRIHEIFFRIPMSERMAFISRQRARELDVKQKSRLSPSASRPSSAKHSAPARRASSAMARISPDAGQQKTRPKSTGGRASNNFIPSSKSPSQPAKFTSKVH